MSIDRKYGCTHPLTQSLRHFAEKRRLKLVEPFSSHNLAKKGTKPSQVVVLAFILGATSYIELMPKEKFRKVYSQPLGLYHSLSVLPTSFALFFLIRF